MSENYAQPLRLPLQSSRAFAVLLAAVHVGAAACSWFTPLPVPLRLGIGAVICHSLYRALVLHAWRRAPAAVTAIEIRDGALALRRGVDTPWLAARVRAIFTHPWVVVLRLRCAGQLWPVNVVIPRGALSPEHFRRLRVRLAYLDNSATV